MSICNMTLNLTSGMHFILNSWFSLYELMVSMDSLWSLAILFEWEMLLLLTALPCIEPLLCFRIIPPLCFNHYFLVLEHTFNPFLTLQLSLMCCRTLMTVFAKADNVSLLSNGASICLIIERLCVVIPSTSQLSVPRSQENKTGRAFRCGKDGIHFLKHVSLWMWKRVDRAVLCVRHRMSCSLKRHGWLASHALQPTS